MSRITHTLLASAAMAVAAMVFAAAALAQTPGGSYSGPAATGGTVSLEVGSTGGSVNFSALHVPTSCGNTDYTLEQYTVPISPTGAFSGGTPFIYGLTFSGSFTGPDAAAGTLAYSTYNPLPLHCFSSPIAWTATPKTGSTRPHKTNCKKIKNKKKRKRCIKKAKQKANGRRL